MNDSQARAIAAVVQRHLPAVLADLRTQHTQHTLEERLGPCIFCGCVEKHVPGCMFQDNESDAKCVADLMARCLPELLLGELPTALRHTIRKHHWKQTAGGVRQVPENEQKSNPRDSAHDPRSRAIFRVMQLHTPAVLADALPAALHRTLPDILSNLLPQIMSNVLPTILPDILPSILPALFALPPSFTSSYDSSSFEGSPSPPPQSASDTYSLRPRDLTDLGAALLPHLLAHLQPQLAKMHARSMARGVHYWQKTAFLDLEETAEGYKGELGRLRDEGVEEVRREAERALEGVREEAGGVAEDVEDQVCERVEEEIRRRGEKAVGDVRRAIRAAARETEQLSGGEARRRGSRRGGKGGYRGVGCRGGPVA